MQRYNADLHIRITEEERKKLADAASQAGLRESEYVRKLLSGNLKEAGRFPVLCREQQEQLMDLTREINHIGVNINQIVKNHNSHFYSQADKKRLAKLLEEVYALMFEWRDIGYGGS